MLVLTYFIMHDVIQLRYHHMKDDTSQNIWDLVDKGRAIWGSLAPEQAFKDGEWE